MLQPVPAQEQLLAPLQATMHEPAHCVMRQVPASWQSSVQPPPGHAIVHVVAVQSWLQPPASGHVIAHDDEPVHVWAQPPPVHVSVQLEAVSHV